VARLNFATFQISEADRELQSQFEQGLTSYLKHHGIDPARFHETLTTAWVHAVWHFMPRSAPCQSADDLIARNLKLLDARIMLTHYSAARLFSADARAAYIEPDLQEIPRWPT
jgi:hypothetical protein